ncbi:MAG: DsrE family protein [Chloroflexota bacterium]
MSSIMIHNTHGNEDVERASLAFVLGNTSLSSGQETSLLMTIDGVFVATTGYTDGLQAEGFPPLAELVNNFVSNGGKVLVCGACAKPRHIIAEDLIDGAELVGAATAIANMVNGAQVISF